MHKELFIKAIGEFKKGIQFHSMMYKWSNYSGYRGFRRVHWFNELEDHNHIKCVEEFILNGGYDFKFVECDSKISEDLIGRIKKTVTYEDALNIYYEYECSVYNCLVDVAYKFAEADEKDLLAYKFILALAEDVKMEKVNVLKTITFLEKGGWDLTLIMQKDQELHDKFKKEM